jgi:hypothetical protein
LGERSIIAKLQLLIGDIRVLGISSGNFSRALGAWQKNTSDSSNPAKLRRATLS